MITKIKGNEYYLTRAQYEARKQAGTLVDGAEYHITDDKFIACYTTMPSATADNAGLIVQYVGDTSENYTNGYLYKSVNNTWSRIDVQPGGSGGGVPEAPEDGKIYGRKDGDWAEVSAVATNLDFSIVNGKLCVSFEEE